MSNFKIQKASQANPSCLRLVGCQVGSHGTEMDELKKGLMSVSQGVGKQSVLQQIQT